MSNALRVIVPYWYEGSWVFDDSAVDLEREPFVLGIPEMIDHLVTDIPDARQGFRLIFSSEAFPGAEIVLIRGREDSGGTWYRLEGTESEGWLCPALFKYFDEAPHRIHAHVEAIRRGQQ